MEDDLETVGTPRFEKRVPHYHGDIVRALMIVSAIVMLIAETFWRALPFSVPATIVAVIALAIFAGLTNPNVQWVHWVNIILAIVGVLVFGGAVLTEGLSLRNPGSVVNEILALTAIFTLYFATRTLRGVLARLHARRTSRPE